MGARPEDYARVAPYHSYIHVDEFESPRHLAAYLHKLDTNDTLYNRYFRWKHSGIFIDTKFYCQLCAHLHQKDISGHKFYQNITAWWYGKYNNPVCVRSTNYNKYASWRLKHTPFTYKN